MVPVADQIQYFESISYVGIFIAVVLSGHIIPVPEDITMLIIGYIAATEVVRLSLAIGVAIVAITFADFGLYFLSLHGSKLTVFFKNKIKANIITWYTDQMKGHTFRVMFVSRFIPGLRFVNPLIAGVIKIHPLKFLLYSFCSACIYVPLMILIGFFFHSKIVPLVTAVESTRHILFVIFIVAVGVVGGIIAKKKFFA